MTFQISLTVGALVLTAEIKESTESCSNQDWKYLGVSGKTDLSIGWIG